MHEPWNTKYNTVLKALYKPTCGIRWRLTCIFCLNLSYLGPNNYDSANPIKIAINENCEPCTNIFRIGLLKRFSQVKATKLWQNKHQFLLHVVEKWLPAVLGTWNWFCKYLLKPSITDHAQTAEMSFSVDTCTNVDSEKQILHGCQK